MFDVTWICSKGTSKLNDSLQQGLSVFFLIVVFFFFSLLPFCIRWIFTYGSEKQKQKQKQPKMLGDQRHIVQIIIQLRKTPSIPNRKVTVQRTFSIFNLSYLIERSPWHCQCLYLDLEEESSDVLINQLLGQKMSWPVAYANARGTNTLRIADFKLSSKPTGLLNS